jgi:cysteine synthase A
MKQMIYQDITQLVGSTPLVRLNRLSDGLGVTLLAKMESMNPGGSVKDRLALAMITAAEKEGLLGPRSVVIEPTSGNTGIGLAMVCAVRGYRLIIVMPESASLERRAVIRAYGAEVVLTPAAGGMNESIRVAGEIAARTPGAFVPMQFSNPANAEMHRRTTAMEIWNATGGHVDLFVAGSGTGGTITGVSEILKQKNPALVSVVVEPATSPVLSGGAPGKHKIQGIGPGFVPEVLNTRAYDEIILVSDTDAMAGSRKLASGEGILAGISSGANFHAALEVAQRPANRGKTIVFMVCDTGERYLSTHLFEMEDNG